MAIVMPTLQQSFEERNIAMTEYGANLAEYWQQRLTTECPEQSQATRQSIVTWLLGVDLERFDLLNPKELAIAEQAMEYRWRILHKRYLSMGRERAYRQLISRLASVVAIRNKIQTWISLSRDRQRSVIDVLQEVLQELLQSDSYIQQQMKQIAALTTDKRLRDTLLFASVEEYCLRPVRNQPILMYRFVNYLRRIQRGGLTQVPSSELVRLVSEEILAENNDSPINLVDNQAIAKYQETQQLEEQQANRQRVQQEFEKYLLENIGQLAVDWLRLYLQGKSQEEIAKQLNKPIKEVYRLREKLSYHAVRVFAIKGQSELIDNWLSTSLEEHNLGLTETKWQELPEKITPLGQQILNLRKAGNSIEAIAQQLQLKTHQVLGEWTKVYLAAQTLRIEN
ncbi:MAG: HetZ-related protein 2 [Dolichospermum sp. DET50]|nr:HetZ-related protein 2 [Dolichospermum sp. DET66]MBS3033826.1 HetZ-related protein 2 [Dolichospermum sp. DET67]MBS3039029.1 HetZ-related protein 2 [Dolichospermum sp. DET50]QSX66281.1 MAG: HetZ-related protein 2 [Dolichospermum sp. DET69]